LGPFLSHILFFRSYHYWDMSRSAMVWTLQPLVVIPLSWLVFHTAVTGWRLIGGLIILAGALALAALHRKGAQEPIEVIAEVETEEAGAINFKGTT
jgi:drug/metabolite transporter (DMT)-like permease